MIGGLIGVLAFVFVAIVVVSALLRPDEKRDPVSPIAQPTATETTTTQPPTRPTAQPTKVDPTSQPTSGPVRALNRSVKNNTLYRAGTLAQPKCPAGNVNIYRHAQLKALILKTSKCMDRAWAPALAKVGIRWTPPRWVIAQGKGRGPCGVFPPAGSVVPYYCPSNKTIYVSTSAVAKGYGVLGSWHGIITSMMGHEYGHHVQQLSGISDSWWQQMLATRSQSARLALTRRHELQATCFGGIFMRSVAASYPIPAARRDQLLTAYSYLGDQPGGPRDHGSTRNNAMWFRQGYMRPRPYQCNTWVMAASYVS